MSVEQPREAYEDRDRFARLLLGLIARARQLERELAALEPDDAASAEPADRHDRLAAHAILGALALGRRLEALTGTAGVEARAPGDALAAPASVEESVLR